jgi:hypothetical protein
MVLDDLQLQCRLASQEYPDVNGEDLVEPCAAKVVLCSRQFYLAGAAQRQQGAETESWRLVFFLGNPRCAHTW